MLFVFSTCKLSVHCSNTSMCPISVPAAVQTLPVKCAHLQTAAWQAKQGAGRPGHVPRSGKVESVVSVKFEILSLFSVQIVVKALRVLQVAHCYLQHLSTFPQELTELLLSYHTVLEPDLRMVRTPAILQIHLPSDYPKQHSILCRFYADSERLCVFLCPLDLLQSADPHEE